MFKKNPSKLIGNINVFSIISNKSIESHKKVKGSKINILEKVPFSLPFWETQYYKKKIKRYLKSCNKQSTVLDAGCGDGRFTLLLLELGFKNIIAFDSNIESLLILENNLKKMGKTKNVTLVCGSVLDMPFVKNYFDIILCIGVLYYLDKNYEKALRQVIKSLKFRGLLLETEPDKEGNALKALIFDGIKQFLNVVKHNRFIEYFGSKPLELRCFDDAELKKIFENCNLNIIAKETISIFPSLLTIGRKKKIIHGINKSGLQIKQIRKSFDYLSNNNGIAKHNLWILKKK